MCDADAMQNYVDAETSVLANDLKTENFSVLAVNPGWVETDMGGEYAESSCVPVLLSWYGYPALTPAKSIASTHRLEGPFIPHGSTAHVFTI